MTQVGKAAVLVSTLGAVGGGVAVASGAFSKPEKSPKKEDVVTISSKLASEGFELLNSSSSNEEWEKVLTVYRQATTKIFAETKEASKTKEQLWENCSAILNKEDLTGNDYQLAKKWCVKKESINTVLERGGYKLLKLTEPQDPEEKPLWTKKIEDLKRNKDKFLAVKPEISDENNATDTNIAALKKGCTNLQINSTETTSDTFDKNFDLARDWCSVKTTNKG